MENLCTILLKTFNTNILNLENISTQTAFYSLSLEYENTDKDNTLFKLIRNHYRNNKPVINYIGGPYILQHLYNKEYDINIYLFGEVHYSTIDCPTDVSKKIELVENYFSNLITNTDVFLDVYIEFLVPYTKEKYSGVPRGDSRLTNLFKIYQKCIETITRKNKECQLSRIHYVDIRQQDGTDFSNLDEISWFITNVRSSITLIKKDNNKINDTKIKQFYDTNYEKINKIFTKLTTKNQQEYVTFWKNTLLQNKYIKKEIEKSMFTYYINKYISDNLEKAALAEKQRIIYYINNIQNNNDFANNLIQLFVILAGINSILMDGYTLSRIFKTFNVTEKLNQPKTPHNIIYYSGSKHTFNLYKFLLSVGFIKIEESGKLINNETGNFETNYQNINKYSNCIDMENIKQPLFNK